MNGKALRKTYDWRWSCVLTTVPQSADVAILDDLLTLWELANNCNHFFQRRTHPLASIVILCTPRCVLLFDLSPSLPVTVGGTSIEVHVCVFWRWSTGWRSSWWCFITSSLSPIHHTVLEGTSLRLASQPPPDILTLPSISWVVCLCSLSVLFDSFCSAAIGNKKPKRWQLRRTGAHWMLSTVPSLFSRLAFLQWRRRPVLRSASSLLVTSNR